MKKIKPIKKTAIIADLEKIIGNTDAIFLVLDKTGNIVCSNNQLEKCLENKDCLGKDITYYLLFDFKPQKAAFISAIKKGTSWNGNAKLPNKKNKPSYFNLMLSPLLNSKGKSNGFMFVGNKLTAIKKSASTQPQKIGYYDELTGLLNRPRFMEIVNDLTALLAKEEKSGILLLIDIDDFRIINDTFGYNTGDEFLRRIGNLITDTLLTQNRGNTESEETALSKKTVIGRLGADEFAVFLPGTDTKTGYEMAELIREKIEVYRILSSPIKVTVTIGIVQFPDHGENTGELFTRADISLTRARELGNNRCHLYIDSDRDVKKMHSRMEEKGKIEKALAEDRFEPWFQPILYLKDDKIHHYEALARMREKSGEILMPGSFIDTAERFGLIGSIDRMITEKTIKLQAKLAKEGTIIDFCMNLSGKNLGDENLLSFLVSTIKATKTEPIRLVFEITETAAIKDLAKATHFINELKKTGCKFALDDFGIGFTSFLYLQELNVDYIKIDGTFIRRMAKNVADQLFVKTIRNIASKMGIKCVAEFVEDNETLMLLNDYGIHYAQGFLIGKPAPWK